MTTSDPVTIEAQYQAMNARRDADRRNTDARRDAATARQVAQAFSEYGRAFRQHATAKRSPIDYLVAIDIAEYCERKAVEFVTFQNHCAQIAGET